ncbi:hypothetical protein V6Z12_D01G168600 [Gossypium hirsutum]
MCCVIRQSSDIGKGYCLFVSSRLRRECICNIIAWGCVDLADGLIEHI